MLSYQIKAVPPTGVGIDPKNEGGKECGKIDSWARANSGASY